MVASQGGLRCACTTRMHHHMQHVRAGAAPEPTNEMEAMSGWSRMRFTVSCVPCTMLSTPLGRPGVWAGEAHSSMNACMCSTMPAAEVAARRGLAYLKRWHSLPAPASTSSHNQHW